jgi:transposase
MKVAPEIVLTDEERTALERWSRGRSTPARLVVRSRIVLLAAEGKMNQKIAPRLKTALKTVSLWRRRFAEQRVAGIEKDAPRGGRPKTGKGMARLIVEKTTQERPANATHWSTRTLAKELGTSFSMVQRVWKANGLKPHLTRTFKLSNDPHFVEKVIDVVGLYLNPPEHALLVSADEKTRFHMHFIPTSGSWLNLIERWFREITDKRLRRGTFLSVEQLIEAIMAFIKEHNDNPQSFVWTVKAEDILAKVRRARAVLDKTPSA